MKIIFNVDKPGKTQLAPLTTVNVERFFSKHRDILRDKRKSFSVENLDKFLFIYYNYDE